MLMLDAINWKKVICYFLISLFLGIPILGIVTSDLGQSSEDNILENIREANYTADEPCVIGYYNPTGSNNSDDCIAASAGYYVVDDSWTESITNGFGVTIAAGEGHTCAILDDGSVSCWGANSDGQLGDGTTTNRNTPTQTSSLGPDRTAVAITAGRFHTCAILDDGSVSCWGENLEGRLGDGTTTDRNTPTQTSSLGTDRTAVAITAGEYHTCAILDDGSVSCWGYNGNGGLGDGNNIDRDTPTQTTDLGLGTRAVAITAGGFHTCAILDDGSVSCWGWNTNGELGDGTNTDQYTPTQTSSLGTGRTAVAIDAGRYHTCTILDDSSVSCWGRNNYAQLGDGTNYNQNTPTQTSSLGTDRTAVVITAGASHTCAILDDGSVSCWGRNTYGQLGDGTNTASLTPIQTSSLGTGRTAVEISVGFYHTCAILDNESVSCWGYNGYGQLGDGTNTARNTPTQTSSLGSNRAADAITAGYDHECVILDNVYVSCWGRNHKGQLGDGTTTDRNTPTQTSSLGSGRTAVAITAGEDHTCAILDDGSVACWGDNGYGKLGDGTTTNRNTPTQTSSLGPDRTAVAISAGKHHTCAILDNGTVSCWGKNDYGQLGDGTNYNQYTPTQTSSLGTGRTAVAITAGDYHTCVILDNESVSCWGKNNIGQLGDGTYDHRITPTQTSSLGTGRTAVAVSSGANHVCVILDDGSVSCWGHNYYGQLGIGTTIPKISTPTQTSSLGTDRTAVAITAGYHHTCAILDDGSVSCWGENVYGQLGDGTTTSQNTPTQTSSLGTGRTAVEISLGKYHTCAILDDGSVSCWGENTYGSLGDGTNNDWLTPTQTSSLGTGRTAVTISAGNTHTCAIIDDGSVSCWGKNDVGQLGDGTTTSRNTPTQTSSLGTGRTAVAIDAGYYHTCAILDDGSVSCWGKNGNGQLGDGTTTNRNIPTQTSSLGVGRTAVAITAGI
jgi:alpha-tubulin suppressor-like RCC1 family protein